MLGRSQWTLQSGLRRPLYRAFGALDVETRQKWAAVHRLLPAGGSLSVLDAGCGSGLWALELAARHPAWTVTGIDIDGAAIDVARRSSQRLGLANVGFRTGDLLDTPPERPVDLIVTICAFHYLIEDGAGPLLFERVASWLRPGGRLVCLVPRRSTEVPWTRRLPIPDGRDAVRLDELRILAEGAGLEVHALGGRVGRLGSVAKQVARLGRTGTGRVLQPVAQVAALTLAAADRPATSWRDDGSYFLLLDARSVAEASPAP